MLTGFYEDLLGDICTVHWYTQDSLLEYVSIPKFYPKTNLRAYQLTQHPKLQFKNFCPKLVSRQSLKAHFPQVAVKCDHITNQKIFQQSKTCAVCETSRLAIRGFLAAIFVSCCGGIFRCVSTAVFVWRQNSWRCQLGFEF